ncbi:MAG: hypothetical protein K6B38_01685 [Ruminococcus sp.]|nr:hypothetical protein [Ruminococcus sp.]
MSEGTGAIDIDHCIREDGSLNDVAASILGIFSTAYFEKSPSGTGLRGFFKLSPDFAYDKTVYYINNRKHGLEVYLPGTTNRFVTVTGDMFRAGTVTQDDAALKTALDTFMKRTTKTAAAFKGSPVSYFTDEQVIKHASESRSGDKFTMLWEGRWSEGYDSQSDADMAFVSMLCFWCGCVEEQIDRIFRSSGLMRDKWDRMTGDATYGQITIRNAVASCSEIYRPVAGLPDEDDILLDFTDLDADSIQEERDRREREGYTFTPDYRHLNSTIEELSPHTSPRYESFQIGNGRMFVDFFRSIILMNDTRGRWYIYDGRVWRPDQHDIKIAEMAKDFRDALLSFAPSITSEDTRKRFLDRVQKLDQRKYRDLMVKDAASDPYLYGYWLGNGNATKPEITVRTEDVEDIISFIPYKVHNHYPQKCGGSEIVRYSELKAVLLGSFREKKIRPEYLRASAEQRWALLQGLMDSDGCIGERKGQSVYVTTLRDLALSVRELLWSLGIKNAVKCEPSTRHGWPTGEILYIVRFTTFDDQPTSRLKRKYTRTQARVKETRSCFHYLLDIQPVDHPVKMQCIQVDSPSHQYLAGTSFVPTHNSELAAAIALYLLYADNEPSAEVYGATADRQQASIVFDVAKRMVEMTPALLKRSKIMVATKRLVNYSNVGFYQVLSAEVGTKHALSIISGLVC